MKKNNQELCKANNRQKNSLLIISTQRSTISSLTSCSPVRQASFSIKLSNRSSCTSNPICSVSKAFKTTRFFETRCCCRRSLIISNPSAYLRKIVLMSQQFNIVSVSFYDYLPPFNYIFNWAEGLISPRKPSEHELANRMT